MSERDARGGFSLIEVLGVVALISVVFFVALNFYTDLSQASARASHHTHDIRRAAAVLDRVSRDFEAAMLVAKPAEVDPIAHPWLFVAEPVHSEIGADHVKFVTRNHDPTRTENPESDFAVVSYTTETDEYGDVSLYRWSTPRLPESLDRDYPSADDERSYLVAEGLAAFDLQFVSTDGEAVSDWDSTTLERSSTLPLAVDIQIAMAPRDPETDEFIRYRRRAIIPVRPLDFELLLNPTAAGTGTGEDDTDSDATTKTVADCIDISSADDSDNVVAMWISLFPSISASEWDAAMITTMPSQIQGLVDPSCR